MFICCLCNLPTEDGQVPVLFDTVRNITSSCSTPAKRYICHECDERIAKRVAKHPLINSTAGRSF
jgi:hypothetical protein